MARYTPPSIDSYGGLEPFLNAKEVREKHNDYGYDDLVKNWRDGVGGVNVSNLAIMFGVSWPTMDGYLNRYHRETGIPRPGKELANTSDIADNNE